MDTVRRVQVKDAALRKTISEGGEFVLFDGDEPVARVVTIAAELKRNEARFVHYPHDPAECLYTCWRHPRQVETATAAAVAE